MPVKSLRVEIRVTEAEKQSWGQAAGGQRKVSEWLRSLANQAAHTTLAPPQPVPVVRPAAHPLDATSPTGAVGKVTIRAACPRAHFHSPGVYCKSCGKVS